MVGAVDDDTNYLLAQLVRELGDAHVVDDGADPGVLELFEQGGLDVLVHPEDIIAGEILRRIYQSTTKGVAVLEHDEAKVLEIVVDAESVLAGDSLSDVTRHLSSGFVVGAIVRGTLRTPRGSTIIQTGDHVIAFVDKEDADETAERI